MCAERSRGTTYMIHKSQEDDVISYLTGLGFEEDLARLYRTLVVRGPLTILQISRLTGIERTLVYRKIQDWLGVGLIEEQLAHKTKLFRAAPADRVKLIVSQKKAAMDALAGSFASFAGEVSDLANSGATTKILYYQGRAGMRQMLWNQMRAKELLSWVYRSYQEAVGQAFFNSWAEEFRKRGIPNRELRHPDFLRTIDELHLEYRDLGPMYQWRNLSPKILPITHGMDIYNDVVDVTYWQGTDVFGIEIYNAQIARMQQSMFDHFWQLAGAKRKKSL